MIRDAPWTVTEPRGRGGPVNLGRKEIEDQADKSRVEKAPKKKRCFNYGWKGRKNFQAEKLLAG